MTRFRLHSYLYIAVLAFLFAASPARAGEDAGSMGAAILTRELGDPQSPGNLKIALTFPRDLLDDETTPPPDAFRVHVYPDALTAEQGGTDRYLADGVYVWRDGTDVFLDVRAVPRQDGECSATVRVAYVPAGGEAVRSTMPGAVRYTKDNVDVVLAVDVSLSMNIYDPDKLRVAAARTFLDLARQGGGVGRVGLVTFNHEANLITPLLPLDQGERLLADLDRVGAEGLTNLDLPLEYGLDELKDSRRPVVILLTDGRNEGTEYKNTHLKAAEQGVRIFAVGLSKKADHDLLRKMAETTGGIYFRAVEDKDLPEIYARLAAELGKRQLIQATSLETAAGTVSYPIDASVKRMVAYADYGARVQLHGPGGATIADSGDKGVHMGSPAPGTWEFAWSDADPDQSSLTIYGDTQFFLDVFPPRLGDKRLAVGVTLAEGVRPLPSGTVWVEPIPGIIPERLALYDDGRHGDGQAGDGVYSNSIALPENVPGHFEIVVRAGAEAWEYGASVRQAHGAAFRNSYVDFGILYPGETGTAVALVDFQSGAPRDLDLDLAWEDATWPALSSVVSLSPGDRALELEMTVPDNAVPGVSRGRLLITDGGDIVSRSQVGVTVGEVVFGPTDPIDLGVVPPGTFVSREIRIPYRASKTTPLALSVPDSSDLSMNDRPGALAAGDGEVVFEAVVSAPMGGKTGEYTGTIALAAGPGKTSVSLRWQVLPLAARPLELAPVTGVPRPPSLGQTTKPLTGPDGPSQDLWKPDSPVHTTDSLESPWEKVSDLFDGTDQPHSADAAPSAFDFSTLPTPKTKGGSFWSAWWLYILAALLLLLLLLLLLAYILYRLGKSALARFLLASAIANIIMLIIFIALLGSSLADMPKPQPSVMVTLVESDEPPGVIQFTETERAMMEPSSTDAVSQAASGGVAAAAISLEADAASSSSGGLLPEEKEAKLPDGPQEGVQLAQASTVEPMPLRQAERQTLNRRERRIERQNFTEPAHEIPDMNEPPPHQPSARQTVDQAESDTKTAEARVTLESPSESERPVWSDGDRPQKAVANEQGVLLAESPGAVLEKIALDRLVKNLDPAARRGNHKEMPQETPEPRSPIDDPSRDSTELAANRDADNNRPDPGVEEIRVEARAIGSDALGRKPGAPLPPGVSPLVYAKLEPMPRGATGGDLPVRTSPLGSRRATKGTGIRTHSDIPGRDPGLPGVALARADGRPGAEGTGQAHGGDAGEVGEQRFDEMGGADGGFDGSLNGMANGRGTTPVTGSLTGAGTSPSPFASSGGGGERMAYQPSSGTGSGADRDSARRAAPDRTDRSNGNGRTPDNLAALPGGVSGTTQTDDNNGTSSRGRVPNESFGEGRYDSMARPDATEFAHRGRGLDDRDAEKPTLADDDKGSGIEFVRMPPAQSELRRSDRRPRRRVVSVAASSVDTDSLLIVLGDFSRLPDPAARTLFASLDQRLGRGLAIEERVLSPMSPALNDCLLALVTPEEVRDWSDEAVANVARYLKRGGHIWLDATRTDQARAFMSRLEKAVGGAYEELPSTHQINDAEIVDALIVDDRIAAVVTYQDWRRDWRHGPPADPARALRFLVRGLNYFLSGDAETGISLEPQALASTDLYIEPSGGAIPDSVSSGVGEKTGHLWDDFGPDTAATWRMPGWSDPGRIAAISDGQGGRALKLDLASASKGRAAVYRTLTPPQDFSGVQEITFDAYYDGGGDATLSMVFTVRDDDGWSDYETPAIRLRKGWNPMRFDMTASSFRALSDDGIDDQPLTGAGETGRAGFFVYRDAQSPAVALFRNIRLVSR